jgi:tetratricopeptide (TPR) repeat protein
VATEEQLWGESFDRELSAEQLFSIQSDVASQVAVALQATLSADEVGRIGLVPTDNLEAYDAYLKGLEYYHKPGQLEKNLVPSRRKFKQAIELDPTFALAYAGLARAAADHYWLGSGGRDALHETRRAAEQALAISPDLSEGHLALGTYYYMTLDYDAALKELNIAEEGLPGNSDLLLWKAFMLRRRGMWDQALRDMKRALALNPRDAEANAEIGFTLLNMRRYEEADVYYCDALDLAPDYPVAKIYSSMLPLLRDGSAASAQVAADGIESVAEVQWKYVHGWQAMISVGDFERAARMATATDRVSGQWHDYPQSLLLGWTYQLEGREADAAEQFAVAVRILEDDVTARPKDARLHTSLGIAYAGLGRFEEAIRAGRRGAELMPIARDTFVGTWLLHDLGWIYVMAGELDAAVDAFDSILEIPSVWSIELLLADPRTNPLRDHEGFQGLVNKYSRSANV